MINAALYFGIVMKGSDICEKVYEGLSADDLPANIFTAMYQKMLLHQVEPSSSIAAQKLIITKLAATLVGLGPMQYNCALISPTQAKSLFSEGHNWLIAFLEWARKHHQDNFAVQLLDAVKFEVALLYDIGKKYQGALDVVTLHKIALELTTYFQAQQG